MCTQHYLQIYHVNKCVNKNFTQSTGCTDEIKYVQYECRPSQWNTFSFFSKLSIFFQLRRIAQTEARTKAVLCCCASASCTMQTDIAKRV